MSHSVQEYILSIGERINRRQLLFLMVLGYHHQEYRNTYWPSHASLAAETQSDEREVRRMVKELRELGIITFERGVGRGNRGAYVFPEMGARKPGTNARISPEKEGTKEGIKEGIFTHHNKEIQILKELQEQQRTSPDVVNAMRTWIRLKSEFEQSHPEDKWVRSAYFLYVLSGRTLLLTLPPCERIVSQARASKDLRQAVREAGFEGLVFAPHPKDDDLWRLEQRYPLIYAQLPAALRRKYERKKKPAQSAG